MGIRNGLFHQKCQAELPLGEAKTHYVPPPYSTIKGSNLQAFGQSILVFFRDDLPIV
jgi:hypothetical protein